MIIHGVWMMITCSFKHHHFVLLHNWFYVVSPEIWICYRITLFPCQSCTSNIETEASFQLSWSFLSGWVPFPLILRPSYTTHPFLNGQFWTVRILNSNYRKTSINTEANNVFWNIIYSPIFTVSGDEIGFINYIIIDSKLSDFQNNTMKSIYLIH